MTGRRTADERKGLRWCSGCAPTSRAPYPRVAALGLLGGAGIRLAGWPDQAEGPWLAVTVLGLMQSATSTLIAVRRRRASVDVIALLALAGALVVGEAFAGAVITVMLASGILLESRAAARARRELSLLVERAPRTARRHVGDSLVTIDVEQVRRGDRLLVGAGEVVPVDGRLLAPSPWPGWPGCSAATRSGRWLCWSLPPRARSCSPHPSRSCPGCRVLRGSA